MINDDVLIKIMRTKGFKYTWPDQVRYMKSRLEDVKKGFPGIRNDHLDIIEFGDICPDDIFIYDEYLVFPKSTEDENETAPVMYKALQDFRTCMVEGIGYGNDLYRDPERKLLHWKDVVSVPNLPMGTLVLRVNVRPKNNGGPGYWYFYRSYRDYRV